jgi:DNA-binding transcriptional ArsR family regulator
MRGNVAPLTRGGLEEDTALLWRALADPTRRRILDLLRQRPLITGEIAAQFPISRIAVMRHLEVLSEAGLAVSRKRGRQRWHYLNTVPLQNCTSGGLNRRQPASRPHCCGCKTPSRRKAGTWNRASQPST